MSPQHVSAYVSQLARQDSNLDLRIQSSPSYQLDDRRNADTKRHAFHANTCNNSMGNATVNTTRPVVAHKALIDSPAT